MSGINQVTPIYFVIHVFIFMVWSDVSTVATVTFEQQPTSRRWSSSVRERKPSL